MSHNGIVKLNKAQFSKIISEYYQKNYRLNVVFDFLSINYECPENYSVLEYYVDKDMIVQKSKIINAYLPCLIDKNAYEYYKKRNIVIPGIIELKNLSEEIKKVLPPEIKEISNEDIIEIFRNLGYYQPAYNWFYDKENNEIEYNVILKRIDIGDKCKVLEY